MVTEREILQALRSVYDPELNKNVVKLGMVKQIAVNDGNISITLALTTSRCPKTELFVAEVDKAVKSIAGVSSVDVKLTTMTKAELEQLFPKHPLIGIQKTKHFIAVGSGKGGVGKTTVAINLALALSRQGLKVGLLDADIYGPSIPTMLDIHEQPALEEGMILPIEKFGLKVMSIGFMIGEDQPVIWRGPMVARTIKDFLNKVMWGELDFLVVDLPPGTGDPSITIAQSIPDAALVVVTTPQKVALADVKKAIHMFRKMDKEIIGIVENMSYFRCEHATDKIEIFGQGGGEYLSRELNLGFLGALPLDIELRKSGDLGIPLMVNSPDSESGAVFQEIAKGVLESVSQHSPQP